MGAKTHLTSKVGLLLSRNLLMKAGDAGEGRGEEVEVYYDVVP